MSGVILWLPGRDLLPIAPLSDQSTTSSQAQLQEVLPQAQEQRSLPKHNITNLDMEVVEISSPQAWKEALQEITQAGICGLDLETTGLDPLSCRARLAQLSLPSGRVYVADLWDLARGGSAPLQDLARLAEDPKVKVVGHNLKFDLSFIQASWDRRLKMVNLFDTMLASQVCWAGLYTLQKAPRATKFPWKKVNPEHNLKALAREHLGIDLPKDL